MVSVPLHPVPALYVATASPEALVVTLEVIVASLLSTQFELKFTVVGTVYAAPVLYWSTAVTVAVPPGAIVDGLTARAPLVKAPFTTLPISS
jgi:hypothetical protein